MGILVIALSIYSHGRLGLSLKINNYFLNLFILNSIFLEKKNHFYHYKNQIFLNLITKHTFVK